MLKETAAPAIKIANAAVSFFVFYIKYHGKGSGCGVLELYVSRVVEMLAEFVIFGKIANKSPTEAVEICHIMLTGCYLFYF